MEAGFIENASQDIKVVAAEVNPLNQGTFRAWKDFLNTK